LVKALFDRVVGALDVDPEFSQDISGTGLAGGFAIPVFGNGTSCRGRDDRSGSADVKCPGFPAAGATSVNNIFPSSFNRFHVHSQSACCTGKLFYRFSLFVKGDQESFDLVVRAVAFHDCINDFSHLFTIKRLATFHDLGRLYDHLDFLV
jgi:hypothetical protein